LYFLPTTRKYLQELDDIAINKDGNALAIWSQEKKDIQAMRVTVCRPSYLNCVSHLIPFLFLACSLVRVLEHTLGMQTAIEILALMHMGDRDCHIPDPPASRTVARETPH